ncbi:MAG: pyruvate dehydrogenase (acetyl-transferring) E1 component subunit alpha [Acidobacteria bacterium]|nr:pyruvate dehydrogenase (acetyl-transferring) E1 component subunit alpha [Acidobacteriota bacterium]
MEPIRLLEVDGTLRGDPPVDLDETRRLFTAMVTARAYDSKCNAMQVQGRLATYASFEGQEAAQIGSIAALRNDDWVVATYRDAAAMWFQGYLWANLLLGRMGDERGGAPPEDVNVLPPSITVGAHMIHAVGLGWAESLQGSDRIAMALFGDGATSEGDFHEAMNFAGVFSTPTVFLCQNNGFAISMPRQRQTAAEWLTNKAIGYGMPGVLVDGNDLFAMIGVTRDAVGRARAGDGPTFIEALTFRVGPHTTTDDAARYRSDDLVEEWRRRDPIDRVRLYLQRSGGWDEAWETELAESARGAIEEAVTAAESVDPFEPGAIFDRMYSTPTSAMDRQRAALRRDGGDD